MRRYAITVCRNCGTEYNSVREICPGFQCGEVTPDPVEANFVRKYRTGPVISNPEAVAEGAGGTNVTPEVAAIEALSEDDASGVITYEDGEMVDAVIDND